MNTTMIRAENLRIGDTVVAHIGRHTATWVVKACTVLSGKARAAVNVQYENGTKGVYRRNESVRIQERT